MNIKKIVSIIIIIIILVLVSVGLLLMGGNENTKEATLNDNPFGDLADDTTLSRGVNSDSVSVNSPYFYSNNGDTDSNSDSSGTGNDTQYYGTTVYDGTTEYNGSDYDYTYDGYDNSQYYVTNDYNNYSDYIDNNNDDYYDNLFTDESLDDLITTINAGDYDYDSYTEEELIDNNNDSNNGEELDECSVVNALMDTLGVSKDEARIIVLLNPPLWEMCTIQYYGLGGDGRLDEEKGY